MEKYLLRISCIIIGLLFSFHIAKGQENSDNSTYYYNNFETAVAGTITSLGTSAARVPGSGTSVDAAASTALEGNVCLSSTSTNTSAIGTIGWNFVGNGTAGINLNSNDWEWDFVYKNGSASANDNPDLYATGKNAWRYWLITSTSSYAGNSTKGIYITHYGTTLYLNYRDPSTNTFNTIASVTLPNDQNPRIIKVQRLKIGTWAIYMDAYTVGMTTAKSLAISSTSGSGVTPNVYYHNYLEVSSTSNARFQFDKFDMYTRILNFTTVNANSAANGITPTPYYQDETVIYYGIQVQARGNFDISTSMNFGVTGTVLSGGSYFNTPGSLYRSSDSFYSISSDGPAITNTVQLNGSGATGIQATGVSNVIAASGNTDGTVSIPCYYFLTATTSATLNYGNTPLTSFTVTGPSSINEHSNVNTISFTNTSTTSAAITFATGIDWTGATDTKWNTGTNWSGGVKPSGTQTARIGVVTYGANDPKLDASSSPGNIVIGTTKSVSVDLAGFTLSTGSIIQNSNPTYSATRKTTITNSSSTAGTFTTATLTNNDNFVFANGTGVININITGNYANNVSMTIGNNNPVIFNSASAQTLFDLNTILGAGTNFNNVTFTGTGSKTITGGDFGIVSTGLLTLASSADLFINSAGTLTLYAGKTSPYLTYAQIATIPFGSTIQGNINYQVYFTGGPGFRNYRSMGSPVYDNPTTYTSANGTYKYSNLKNSFIITGSGGAANGFDESYNHGATLRTWNPATNNYTFITTLGTSSTATTGKGFYMYFRGDRTKTGTLTAIDLYGSKTNRADGGGLYAIPETVTYTYTGIPNQGNVSTTFGTNDANYYFISNPYAATLDAGAVINSTAYSFIGLPLGYYINTKIWTWKPGITAQYAIWDFTNPNASPNGAREYIVPGQGFFVQANTSPGGFLGLGASPHVLTITESMKSTGDNLNAVRNLNAAVAAPAQDPPVLRLQLTKNSYTSDEIGMVFQDSTKALADKDDAVHFEGDNLTLSSLSADNKYLAIDKRPFTGNKTIVPLYVTAIADSTYSLQLSYTSALMNNYKVTLYDSLLNANNVINKNAYSFQITNSQANTSGKRFKLIIEPSPAPALFTKFTGKLNELKKVLLNWNSASDRSNITYQVQKSTDKMVFANIGDRLTSLTDNPAFDYQTIDANPQVGINYYRLVQTNLFNNTVYSDTVAVAFNPGLLTGMAKNGFILYPNSVKDVFAVVSDKDYNSKVTMTIYDSQGNLKLAQSYQSISAQLPLQQNAGKLQLGIYIIHLTSNGKELVTLKFNKE